MNKFLQVSLSALSIVLIVSGLFLIVGTKGNVAVQANDSTVIVQIDSAEQTLSKKKQTTTIISPAKPCADCVQKSFETAIGYFGLAGLLLAVAFLLPRIKSISIGGNSIEVKEEAVRELNAEQNASVGVGGRKDQTSVRIRNVPKEMTETNKDDLINDPQKGKWGTEAVSNGRELFAEVKKLGASGYYSINLIVRSLNSKAQPLTGFVAFHLHPSFANPHPIINCLKGEAHLNLTAYGSFTVGAVCDNGRTKLELDLSELKGIDDNFKNN